VATPLMKCVRLKCVWGKQFHYRLRMIDWGEWWVGKIIIPVNMGGWGLLLPNWMKTSGSKVV
jgi:hypothetical protein